MSAADRIRELAGAFATVDAHAKSLTDTVKEGTKALQGQAEAAKNLSTAFDTALGPGGLPQGSLGPGGSQNPGTGPGGGSFGFNPGSGGGGGSDFGFGDSGGGGGGGHVDTGVADRFAPPPTLTSVPATHSSATTSSPFEAGKPAIGPGGVVLGVYTGHGRDITAGVGVYDEHGRLIRILALDLVTVLWEFQAHTDLVSGGGGTGSAGAPAGTPGAGGATSTGVGRGQSPGFVQPSGTPTATTDPAVLGALQTIASTTKLNGGDQLNVLKDVSTTLSVIATKLGSIDLGLALRTGAVR